MYLLAILARLSSNRHLESLAYIIDFTSILVVDIDSSDSSKSNKELFCYYINRVDSELIYQFRVANNDIEIDKIFYYY